MADGELVEVSTAPVEKPEPERRLRPWVAAVLGLLGTGLGQLYTGRLRTGLQWLGTLLVLWLGLGIFVAPKSFAAYTLVMVLVVGIHLAALAEAAGYAARMRTASARWYNQGGIYLLAMLVIYGLTQGASWMVSNVGVAAFRIPTGGMEKTLLVGDHILVDRNPQYVPHAGQVVVFDYPLNPSLSYIKRCVAGPGQTVEIREGELLVNDLPVMEPSTVTYAAPQRYPAGQQERGIMALPGVIWNRDNWGPVTVPDGKFFMLGDNRDNSQDSRYWGFVDQSQIRGRAVAVYWSWDKRASLGSKVRWARIGEKIE